MFLNELRFVGQFSGCFDKPLQNSQLKVDPEPIIELTDNAKPIQCPTRRYSQADRNVITQTGDALLTVLI